jgi:arylsulfatase A-like enzyme
MSEKMNVLFIITDQQRADHLGCAGNPDLKTPNLDRLASEGIRFTNAYVANPICMPNRSTIFTGKYPSIHGVRCNGINLDPNIPTFTQTLLDNGYHTCSIGKIHLNFYGTPFSRIYNSAEQMIPFLFTPKNKRKPIPKPYYGLDEVELTIGHGDSVSGHYLDWIEERAPEYLDIIKHRAPRLFHEVLADSPIPEEIYHTTYITEKTISYLKRCSEGYYGNKPFFLHCSFPDPHHPVCPPGKYKDMYNPDDIEIPSTLNDIKPLYAHAALGPYVNLFRRVTMRETTEEEARKFIAYTYGTLSMIDHGVGQILAALNSFGLEKNTMVIFTSDHGDFMADHGILLKALAHFQGVIKIPFIWKIPEVTRPGTITDSLASSIDIPTTILNLLDVKTKDQPTVMQGYDLTPILSDPEKKVRDHCIIEEDQDYHDSKDSHSMPSMKVRTMITEKYRITVYHSNEDAGDLYNLENDPLEQYNLWDDINLKDLKNKLLNKLLHEVIKLQDRAPRRQARA